MSFNAKLLELGIELPSVAKPVASYKPWTRTGNLVFISGQDCRKNNKLLYEGKVGSDLTVEEGYAAAKQCAINILAVINDAAGGIDNVSKIVKLLGFVNSADGFVEQPFVMNGASDLLIEVFGDIGVHSRSAVSANELPFNTPVEIELIVELKS